MYVYILLVKRHIANTTDVYVDSVFSYEEKAWNRIEEKLNFYINTVQESGYKIKDILIRRKYVILKYNLFIDNTYGEITYEIIYRKIM